MEFRDIQASVGDWAAKAIGPCSWSGITRHMHHEVVEIEEELVEIDNLNSPFVEPSNPSKKNLSLEIADIVILAMHLASKEGIDLEEAVLTKMEINKKRTWSKPDPITQVVHHT